MMGSTTQPRTSLSRRRWVIVTFAVLTLGALGFAVVALLPQADSFESEVDHLVAANIAAWDVADPDAALATMTSSGVHTCSLGTFVADGEGESSIDAAIARMQDYDFALVDMPSPSASQPPAQAVALVRISGGGTQITGEAEFTIVEEDGRLAISRSVFTH